MMDKRGNKDLQGYFLALFTVTVWGTTYISTKVLLKDFSATQILFLRFAIAYVAVLIIYPHRFKWTGWKNEFLLAMGGLTGMSLYQFIENTALTYTTASNVGIIVAAAPFFTAICSVIFLKDKSDISVKFFIGFAVSMIGIVMINVNGQTELKLNPIGDILTLIGTIVWALYSTVSRVVSQKGFSTLPATRRMFFYCLIFSIPMLAAKERETDIKTVLGHMTEPDNIFNLCFLGLLASAICFVTFNIAVKYIGSVRTMVFLYLSPVVTIITSIIVLDEKITLLSATGTVLILFGLIISQTKKNKVTDEKIESES